jgi:hypothetical protein
LRKPVTGEQKIKKSLNGGQSRARLGTATSNKPQATSRERQLSAKQIAATSRKQQAAS